MFDTIILGSKSPRRQELIKSLGYTVEIRIQEVEENYPSTLPILSVPEYLAQKKSTVLRNTVKENELLITSDTIVILDDLILGKPQNGNDAFNMLRSLSGREHQVLTGVNLYHRQKEISFTSQTTVSFDALSDEEISFYINKFNPIDKAGSYGIQEWIGYIGVKGIQGCYYNVMGLPVHDIYQQIKVNFT